MREILFKGKRVDNGAWVYGFYGEENELAFIVQYCKDYGMCGSRTWQVIPETVGQYVGRDDTDGIKVFAGDIIQDNIDLKKYVVEYVAGDWYAFCLVDMETKECLHLYEIDYVSVIGNIHDRKIA